MVLNEVDVKIAFPMHFGDDYTIMERIKQYLVKTLLLIKLNQFQGEEKIYY